MTDITLLSDTLRDWSEEAAVPRDLADRALGHGRTSHSRPMLAALALAAAAAVVAVAVSGTWPMAGDHTRSRVPPTGDRGLQVSADTDHNPPQDLVAAGRLAVSAIVTTARVPVGSDGWQTMRRSYAVADPSTGRYEPTDWSYVSVAPGLATAAVLEGDLPAAKIGLVDLSTHEARWVATDHPVASLAWSPDGSTLVATAYDGDPDAVKPQDGNRFQMGVAARTGFVLVDVAARTADFHPLSPSFFSGRADVGFTMNGDGVWAPSGGPGEQFFDLDGTPVEGDRDAYNSNLSINAAQFPMTSPDGRLTITQEAGLPTAITDGSGQVYRQQALQVLGWADSEHVVTLAGCSASCQGKAEFRNGLVLMRYDGTHPVPLTASRKSAGHWSFQLTPR